MYIKNSIDILLENYPDLANQRENLELAIELIIDSYKQSKKIIIAGNGGSSSDADHIVGELMKGFIKKRPISSELKKKLNNNPSEFTNDLIDKLQTPLRAISLTGPNSLFSAFGNDVDPRYTISQALLGHADENDVFIAISTSGNSKNICAAAYLAKRMGLKVIAFTGQSISELSRIADVTLFAPSQETYRIQEYHLPIYHAMCLEVEAYFFKE